jgi:hypothetical protein
MMGEHSERRHGHAEGLDEFYPLLNLIRMEQKQPVAFEIEPSLWCRRRPLNRNSSLLE